VKANAFSSGKKKKRRGKKGEGNRNKKRIAA
jgi:hypothetical protein